MFKLLTWPQTKLDVFNVFERSLSLHVNMPEIFLNVLRGCCVDDSCVTCAISLHKRSVDGLCDSWRRQKELAEAQTQLCLPGHQLVTESAARWGSRVSTIDVVLEQERALARALSADKNTRTPVFTSQDTEVPEGVQESSETPLGSADALRREQRDPHIRQTCATPGLTLGLQLRLSVVDYSINSFFNLLISHNFHGVPLTLAKQCYHCCSHLASLPPLLLETRENVSCCLILSDVQPDVEGKTTVLQ